MGPLPVDWINAVRMNLAALPGGLLVTVTQEGAGRVDVVLAEEICLQILPDLTSDVRVEVRVHDADGEPEYTELGSVTLHALNPLIIGLTVLMGA